MFVPSNKSQTKQTKTKHAKLEYNYKNTEGKANSFIEA